MTIYSRLKLFSNLIRGSFLVVIACFLFIFVKVVLDNPTSTFNFLMVPCCLIICYVLLSGIISMKTNYNKIVISEKGLKTIGLGGIRHYSWSDLTHFDEEKITGMRVPTYYNFEVFQNNKRILKFDSLTYRNYKKMSEAIREKLGQN